MYRNEALDRPADDVLTIWLMTLAVDWMPMIAPAGGSGPPAVASMRVPVSTGALKRVDGAPPSVVTKPGIGMLTSYAGSDVLVRPARLDLVPRMRPGPRLLLLCYEEPLVPYTPRQSLQPFFQRERIFTFMLEVSKSQSCN